MSGRDEGKLSRRDVVAGGLAGAAALGLASLVEGEEDAMDTHTTTPHHDEGAARMPVVFIPHGGGPYSYVEFGAPADEVADLAGYWRALGSLPEQTPRALLVISAHWEEDVPTIMTSQAPPMLYDYYGFPPESYEIEWPAPGSPWLAARLRELLEGAGIEVAEDAERGFDHGTFVPLKRSFPEADVPVVQISLRKDLDPAAHLALGRALAPLRDEGVFIIGSGMSYHNMRGFRAASAQAPAEAFDDWLEATVTAPHAERDAELVRWEELPVARAVHPREEHLTPLFVVAGAAGEDAGSVPWTGRVFGKRVSAVQFG